MTAPSTAVAVREIGVQSGLAKVEPIMPRTPREVGEFAQFMIDTEILPDSYGSLPGKKKQGAIIIAIMKGMEIGLPPLRALQSLYVVNGKPTLYGDEIPALLLHSGKLEWIKDGFDGQGDTLCAWVTAKRVGNPEPMTRRFSVADAQGMRLLGKAGPWQHSRPRMCLIRARTYLARDLFADVLAGLAIKEEQEDIMRSEGLDPAAFAGIAETADVDPLGDAPALTAQVEADERAPTRTDSVRWAGEEIDPEDPGPLSEPEEDSERAWKHFAFALRTLIERASTPGLKLTWWEMNHGTLEKKSKPAADYVRAALPDAEADENAEDGP